jgi:hypothetical protein
VVTSNHLLGIDRWCARNGGGYVEAPEEFEIDGMFSMVHDIRCLADRVSAEKGWRMDPHVAGRSGK